MPHDLLKRMIRRLRADANGSTDSPDLDLSDTCSGPIEAYYEARGESHIASIPIAKCRLFDIMAFSCDTDEHNPLIKTVLECLDSGISRYEDSSLIAYYDEWHPASAATVLGVPQSSHWSSRHPLAYLKPWQAGDPEKVQRTRYSDTIRENSSHGLPSDDGPQHKLWGPITASKGALEFGRLRSTCESIARNGFVRTMKPPITAEVLARGSDWRVLVRHGQHRVAAMAALGITVAPIHFRMTGVRRRRAPIIIRREDVEYWPQLRSGLFSRQEALAVFDRMFEAHQPPEYDLLER